MKVKATFRPKPTRYYVVRWQNYMVNGVRALDVIGEFGQEELARNYAIERAHLEPGPAYEVLIRWHLFESEP